jgi:hypothetical protein
MTTTSAPPATPAERLRALAAAPSVPVHQALDFYDSLPAVTVEEMLGEWDGGIVRTGHPGDKALGLIRWAGKRFTSAEKVAPLMAHGPGGRRVRNPMLGAARLRMVEYRGVVSGAMVYDRQPIIDHFRRVDDDTLLGVMDSKSRPRPLVFFLTRLDRARSSA